MAQAPLVTGLTLWSAFRFFVEGFDWTFTRSTTLLLRGGLALVLGSCGHEAHSTTTCEGLPSIGLQDATSLIGY
jgi:hypothetical protein